MATVTSFEALTHPTKSELRQFAELFAPLFQASTEEAKREAVAALSRSPNVPRAVASFVACQPIAIAAPFLAASPCLDDDLLIMVARSQGAAHARAIVSRESLSPTVIDALVGLRHDAQSMPQRAAAQTDARAIEARQQRQAPLVTPLAANDDPENRIAGGQDRNDDRDEALRTRIKRLASHVSRPDTDRLGLRTATPVQTALMVRFARSREAHHFATTLTDALSASRWLAERIMLDLSGRQMAVTLTGLGVDHEDAIKVLAGLYPHLSRKVNGELRAENLLVELDPMECHDRIEAWRRADSYTFGGGRTETARPPRDGEAAGPETLRRAPLQRNPDRALTGERGQHARRGR